jgi:general secretion pathway protein J
MMLLLTGSLRIGAESWDAGEERMARASRLYVVENFLRTHIGSLMPVGNIVRNGRVEPAFRGGRDFLAYVAPLPEQVKIGGLYRFELYLAKNGDRQDLRMAILPYSTSIDKMSKPKAEPIDDLAVLENVGDFRLSYLPHPAQTANMTLSPQNPPLQWADEWQTNQIPALIRIDLRPADEEPWPSLFVAPRTLTLR